MQRLVTQAKRDFNVRTLASRIISQCSSKDYACYGSSIHNWVHENIKYIHDAPGVETLVAPAYLLKAKAGDCDDQVMLTAALAESIGIPARFATIKADPSQPTEYSHIFAQLQIPSQGWVTSDTTMDGGFGWDPGSQYERKVWASSLDAPEGEDKNFMTGLAADWTVYPLIPDDQYAFPPQHPLPEWHPQVHPTKGLSSKCKRLQARALAFKNKYVVRIVIRHMSRNKFGQRCSPQAAGLGSFSGTLDDLQSFLNGGMAEKLRAQDMALADQYNRLMDIKKAIPSMPEGAIKTRTQTNLRTALSKYLDAQNDLSQAIMKYNFLASEANRWGMDVPEYTKYHPLFSGMGRLGLIQIPAGFAGAAIVIAAIVALVALIDRVSSAVGGNEGLIQQMANAIRSTGGAIESTAGAISETGTAALKIGTIAIIGLGAWMLYKALAKKGTI